jgi:transcriptional regulator with XRE-family HTH domain
MKNKTLDPRASQSTSTTNKTFKIQPAFKKQSRARRSKLASVSSLVEFRAKRQGTSGEALQVIRRSLWDDLRPLGDRSPADTECARHVNRLLEMGNNIRFVHAPMVTIVTDEMQPCSPDDQLTLVSMEDWEKCSTRAERLTWAVKTSKASVVQIAEACGVSRHAVGKWLSGSSTDLKLENFFKFADMTVVNPRWLATGDETPRTGIPTVYTTISGIDLQIAKELTKLNDKNLRSMIKDLMSAKANAASEAEIKKSAKRKATLTKEQRA